MNSAAPTNRRLRLIVIDDYEDTAKSLSMLLRLAGHDVVTFVSGKQAMQAMESVRPDAVLMDIAMPEMDGYEIADWVRHQSSLSGMPLIAITGCCQPRDRERALEAGFTHFFAKPASFPEINEMLQSLAADLLSTQP